MENTNINIVYIDESNISSYTGHTVYVAVFITYANKQNISNQITDIESNLRISYTHWVDMPWKLRVKFAERIKTLDFVCKVVLYNNPIRQENTLGIFLSEIISARDKIIKIIIDGKKGKRYKERLKNELKNNGLVSIKLMFVDDKGESLVRLADFIAGLIRSYTDDKNKYNQYMFQILKHKINHPVAIPHGKPCGIDR